MKISDNAAGVLAALLDLQSACIGNRAGSIEELAARCAESAARLTVADLAACDREAHVKLRRTANATAAFLRRVVRRRGMRLTMLRFGQIESTATRGIAI
jgi:hypothetical protein